MIPDDPPASRRALALRAQVRRANIAITEEKGRYKRTVGRLYSQISQAEAELAALKGGCACEDPVPGNADPNMQAGQKAR